MKKRTDEGRPAVGVFGILEKMYALSVSDIRAMRGKGVEIKNGRVTRWKRMGSEIMRHDGQSAVDAMLITFPEFVEKMHMNIDPDAAASRLGLK